MTNKLFIPTLLILLYKTPILISQNDKAQIGTSSTVTSLPPNMEESSESFLHRSDIVSKQQKLLRLCKDEEDPQSNTKRAVINPIRMQNGEENGKNIAPTGVVKEQHTAAI